MIGFHAAPTDDPWQCYRDRQYASAINGFNKLLEKKNLDFKTTRKAMLNLAICYEKQRQYEKAELMLKQAHKLFPKFLKFKAAHIRLLETQKKYDPALKMCQQIIDDNAFQNDPDLDMIWSAIAHHYWLHLKDPNSAELYFQNGIKKFPKSFPLLMGYASLLFDIGKFKEAANLYKRLKIDFVDRKNIWKVWICEARLIAKTQGHSESVRQMQEAVIKFPDDSRIMYNLGKHLQFAGRFEEAEKVFDKLNQKNYRNAELALAHLFEDQKKFPEADKLYKKTVANHPIEQWPSAWFDYACFLPKIKGYNEAKAILIKLKVMSYDIAALGYPFLLLRMAGAGLGTYENAIEAFEAFIKTNPKIPKGYLGLAQLYMEREQPELAEKILKDLTNRFPSFSKGWVAYIALKKENFEEAWEIYQTLLKKAGESKEADLVIGIAFYIKRDLDQAFVYTRKALALAVNKRYAEAWSNLGHLYREIGGLPKNSDKSESYFIKAKKCYDKAYEIDPTRANKHNLIQPDIKIQLDNLRDEGDSIFAFTSEFVSPNQNVFVRLRAIFTELYRSHHKTKVNSWAEISANLTKAKEQENLLESYLKKIEEIESLYYLITSKFPDKQNKFFQKIEEILNLCINDDLDKAIKKLNALRSTLLLHYNPNAKPFDINAVEEWQSTEIKIPKPRKALQMFQQEKEARSAKNEQEEFDEVPLTSSNREEESKASRRLKRNRDACYETILEISNLTERGRATYGDQFKEWCTDNIDLQLQSINDLYEMEKYNQVRKKLDEKKFVERIKVKLNELQNNFQEKNQSQVTSQGKCKGELKKRKNNKEEVSHSSEDKNNKTTHLVYKTKLEPKTKNGKPTEPPLSMTALLSGVKDAFFWLGIVSKLPKLVSDCCLKPDEDKEDNQSKKIL